MKGINRLNFGRACGVGGRGPGWVKEGEQKAGPRTPGQLFSRSHSDQHFPAVYPVPWGSFLRSCKDCRGGAGHPRGWLPLLATSGSWTSDCNLATDLRCKPFLPCASVSSLLTRKIAITFPQKDVCSYETFWKYKTHKRKRCQSQLLFALQQPCAILTRITAASSSPQHLKPKCWLESGSVQAQLSCQLLTS